MAVIHSGRGHRLAQLRAVLVKNVILTRRNTRDVFREFGMPLVRNQLDFGWRGDVTLKLFAGATGHLGDAHPARHDPTESGCYLVPHIVNSPA